ncbi:MAG: hypothetical protein J0G95_11025 [Rhizobiales bacterium]|nr:hypothetical protein [Hyphomicrobiales bacterium]
MKRDQEQDNAMNVEKAWNTLGLDPNKWTIQFTDEELRMLKEVMRAEDARRQDIFGGLLENIKSIG